MIFSSPALLFIYWFYEHYIRHQAVKVFAKTFIFLSLSDPCVIETRKFFLLCLLLQEEKSSNLSKDRRFCKGIFIFWDAPLHFLFCFRHSRSFSNFLCCTYPISMNSIQGIYVCMIYKSFSISLVSYLNRNHHT